MNSNLPNSQSNRHYGWQELICHAQQWLRRAIQRHKSLWWRWEMDLWDADGAARDLSEQCPKGNTKREISRSHYQGSLTHRVLQMVHLNFADKCYVCDTFCLNSEVWRLHWQKSHWRLCIPSFASEMSNRCMTGFLLCEAILNRTFRLKFKLHSGLSVDVGDAYLENWLLGTISHKTLSAVAHVDWTKLGHRLVVNMFAFFCTAKCIWVK